MPKATKKYRIYFQGEQPDPGEFPSVLAIGDSWFWYPKNNLLQALLSHPQMKDPFRIATALGNVGATLDDYANGTFAPFWRNELAPQNFGLYSVVLISGGGNDAVNYSFALNADNTGVDDPAACISEDGLHNLVASLVRMTAAMISDVQLAARRIQRPVPPVVLNGYDYPVPDGRGFGAGIGPWIKPALDRTNVAPSLAFRKQVLRVLMDALNMGMQSLAHSIAGVYCPDARGTLRSGTGYKQDWDNELHPTQSGFGKIVDAALIKQMAALGFANP